ncbi:hypothetical protein [Herbaspirillum sp. RV1423]|uniref:hypothetical protein n=1 Tax=Herbaspirillum sp. RV1423 TaxID=1443993 RepID=UPI0004AED881|nr:hypothetical protein [Herbaspirillum sp. RV1423]
MPDFDTSHQATIQPTHRDFRWINGPGRDAPLADFVEMTRDVAAGIHTCLQIFAASELERVANADADPGAESAPAVGKSDAENLLRQAAEARIRRLTDSV